MEKEHNFPVTKGFPIRCRVYVPSTQGLSKISPLQHQQRAKEVKKKMSSLFGGATQIKSQGSWLNPQNTLISEKILLVESYTTRTRWQANDMKIKQYLLQKKREWNQEAISIEWEDLSKNLKYEGMQFI